MASTVTLNEKWRKIAEKELKTTDVAAKLVKLKDEGFAVKPVYFQEDTFAAAQEALPGVYPFT